MNRNRLEAFSDGVIAIIITIMVLEMKVPHGEEWSDLGALWPVFVSYLMSFINVGIYWTNHHHMMHTVTHINGQILWANLGFLFWLSLMPFATGWMGENHFAPIPVVLYCINLLLCAITHKLLQISIIQNQGNQSLLKAAIGKDLKAKISLAGHILATVFAYFEFTLVTAAILVSIAIAWLFPDKRIEQQLHV